MDEPCRAAGERAALGPLMGRRSTKSSRKWRCDDHLDWLHLTSIACCTSRMMGSLH